MKTLYERDFDFCTSGYLFAVPQIGPEFPLEKSGMIPAAFQAAMTAWYMGLF
jgi:hypothetical protein